MTGRIDYEEKKQARIERLRASAEKASEESTARYNAAQEILDYIPAGQPILTDHYSAKRHIGDLNKFDNHMRKSIEADEKAKHYLNQVSAAETNTNISSDDPRAIEKLKEKITELEAKRERVKIENKEARKNGVQLPHPPYRLSYLSRDIKNAKKRIEQLEKISALKNEVVKFSGGSAEIDKSINRVIFRFDEHPSPEITDLLKSYAFKWSLQTKCWQRMITGNALYDARIILKRLKEEMN